MSDSLYSKSNQEQIPTLPNLARNSSKQPGMESEYLGLSPTQDFTKLSLSPLISSTLNLQSTGITLQEENQRETFPQPAPDIEQWGKYQFLNEIGRGGMGKIMLWKDQNIQRTVASKLMLQQGCSHTLQRFYEEGQITGQLEHPNIVPIYEMGLNQDGNVYFTMKYVKGRSLKQLLEELKKDQQLRHQEWTLTKMLQIFQTVCNAIDYAHSKKVIHRDLKPDNIMLGNFGEVMVMDWGLAKVLGQGQEVLTEDTVTTLRSQGGFKTITGQVTGTPRYMAPEQAMGEIDNVDQRSDIYSLGAILYEIVAGTTAADGSSVLVILMNVSQGKLRQVPKQGIYGAVPKELQAIISKCLQLSPDDRYQSARALADDIQRFLDGREVSACSYSWWNKAGKIARRYRQQAAIVVLTVIVLLPLFLLWSDYRSKLASQKKEKELMNKIQNLAQGADFEALFELDKGKMKKTSAKTIVARDVHSPIAAETGGKSRRRGKRQQPANCSISSPGASPIPKTESQALAHNFREPARQVAPVAASKLTVRKADKEQQLQDTVAAKNPRKKPPRPRALNPKTEKPASPPPKKMRPKRQGHLQQLAKKHFDSIKAKLLTMIDECSTAYKLNKEYRYQQIEADCWFKLYRAALLAEQKSWQEIAERQMKTLLKASDLAQYQDKIKKLQQSAGN